MLGASLGVLLLIGSTAAVATAAKPKGGSWAGTTSQSEPLSFHVKHGGLTILSFEPQFIATCTKAGSAPMNSPLITTDAGRNIQIKHGKFHASATGGKIHSGSVTLATASDQVHGKFSSKHKASGTYSVTFKFNNNAAQYGLAGYTCKTGTVSWSATAS